LHSLENDDLIGIASNIRSKSEMSEEFHIGIISKGRVNSDSEIAFSS
jgi:hypothetical protein